MSVTSCVVRQFTLTITINGASAGYCPSSIHSFILSWIAFLVMVVYFLRAHLDAPLGSKVVSPRAERRGVPRHCFSRCCVCMHVCFCVSVDAATPRLHADRGTCRKQESQPPAYQATDNRHWHRQPGNGNSINSIARFAPRLRRTADTEFGPKVQFEH